MQYQEKIVHVLIADDSDVVRHHLVRMIESVPNVQVVAEAETAPHTLELVRKLKPEAVILDIQMPGSGITALMQIKRELPETQVIMLTNHAWPHFRDMCRKAGADYFLDKSLEFEKVPQVLSDLVSY